MLEVKFDFKDGGVLQYSIVIWYQNNLALQQPRASGKEGLLHELDTPPDGGFFCSSEVFQ